MHDMHPIIRESSPAPLIIAGRVITMDPDRPFAEAFAQGRDGRLIAVGSLDEVRAAMPEGTPVQTLDGWIAPGFIDSHFYLQRGGLKVVALFPGGEENPVSYADAMARTAGDPDWPAGPAPTSEDRREGLRRVQPLLHALGITGVVDPWATDEALAVYHQAREAGELTMRVTAMPYFEKFRDREVTPEEVTARIGAIGPGSGSGDDRLRLGAVKVYVDGEGRRRQALRETPWPATGEIGIQAIGAPELEQVARYCASSGWALGLHAIGGRAMRIAMEVLERVDADIPLAALRFRLIHAYLEPSAETMRRAARMGVIVSSQPAIQWHNAVWLRDELGASGAASNPVRAWSDAGVRIALGSDGPYFPFSPLRLLSLVRTRAARGIDEPVGPEQALGAEEALAGLTRDAAFAAFTERDAGMLAPRRAADWVELSVDPLGDAEALAVGTVRRTVAGGRTVFRAADPAGRTEERDRP